MIITTTIRNELLASGWAEPVTNPVRLDTLAHIARNEHVELIAALPHGQTYVINTSDRKEAVEWWSLTDGTEILPLLSADLTDRATEQQGPVRCWITTAP